MRRLLFLLIAFALTGPGFCAVASLLQVSYGSSHKELSAVDFAKLPVVEIEAIDHGQLHCYRGIAVRDVPALVGVPLGDDKLRGPNLALAVRVRAADGYVAAFGLAEFNPAFREHDILLVDTQDGKPLPDSAGPVRFVCPGDKRGGRWVRQVISMEVISLSPPVTEPSSKP